MKENQGTASDTRSVRAMTVGGGVGSWAGLWDWSGTVTERQVKSKQDLQFA